MVGKPKYWNVIIGMFNKDIFFGEECVSKIGILSPVDFYQNGFCTDTEYFRDFLSHILSDLHESTENGNNAGFYATLNRRHDRK